MVGNALTDTPEKDNRVLEIQYQSQGQTDSMQVHQLVVNGHTSPALPSLMEDKDNCT